MTELTYSKPANIFVWVFIFAFFGPLTGLLQILILLFIYTGAQAATILPFGLIYSFLFLIPAALTGLVVYLFKDRIKHYTHMCLFGLVGSIITSLFLLVVDFNGWKMNNFLFLIMFISYVSTVSLTALFIYKEK